MAGHDEIGDDWLLSNGWIMRVEGGWYRKIAEGRWLNWQEDGTLSVVAEYDQCLLATDVKSRSRLGKLVEALSDAANQNR